MSGAACAYPETAAITVTQGTTSTAIVTPIRKSKVESGYPLTVAPTGDLKEVYVALFPQPEQSYTFTVTSTTGDATDGTYTGTATARLVAGEYVVATGLILIKVNP